MFGGFGCFRVVGFLFLGLFLFGAFSFLGFYGRVEDVYMPSKRSSFFNTKFGFIRFKRREEALAAIDALNGFLVRNCRMFVQLAKYSKVSPKVNRMRSQL